MTHRRGAWHWALSTAALLLLLVLAVPAQAQVRHRVREGESFASIARHYYGSAWKSSYLRARNGMFQGGPNPGQVLKIPAAWTYTVRKGDTLAQIAQKYLGEAYRYEVIMRANQKRKATELAVGEKLLMPFHVRHTVQPGDSLSAISRQYYRVTGHAKLLQNYNGGISANLKPGQRLTVPIWDRHSLDVKRKGPPPAPKQANASKGNAPKDERKAPNLGQVEKAVMLYNEGAYAEAEELFAHWLEGPEAEKKVMVLLLQYASYSAVALDEPGEALERMGRWKALAPQTKLDPAEVSPKIRDLFERAEIP